MLPVLQQYLPQGGYLIIATLHPHATDSEEPSKVAGDLAADKICQTF
ncbi:MAG: hypothetical protein ACK4HE_08495 [Chitinophagaceae bacterium]